MSHEEPVKPNQPAEQPNVVMMQTAPSSPAPVKAAKNTLALTWISLLLPIPGVSLAFAGLFGTITTILAIICMAKNNVNAGVWLLVGNFVGGLVCWGLGWLIMTITGSIAIFSF